MKTKLEIIEETVEVYSKVSKRAVQGDVCSYYLNGNTCAVGRCCEDPQELERQSLKINSLGANAFSINMDLGGLDKWLKPKYRGHSVNFWADIQLLHDNPTYWKSTLLGGGLTQAGVNFVERLKREYREN